MNDEERQFERAVQGVFGSPLGAWLIAELRKRYCRPFSADPYICAYNCGAQDLVTLLDEMGSIKRGVG